uniref:Plectin n=1 Tax=Eptatretus burgeri TaxID=7764 RepID=A0A8C4R0D5_EPTBU
MRKLAEESSALKLAAETDVLHMRTSMEEVEQQRTALSEELTLVKQDMGQALDQKNMLEDELFQVKKQVQELMQCKVLAEEEITKNSLQQSEMTQRALDEEATKLVNTIAEVAQLKDMLDEMMRKRKQAEDEAAQQKAEVEHIREEKVAAIQAERHLKEEVERALLDRESEQKELRMMAEKEAQEHQRLVAEAADQQHSAEQELALLRIQFEGDLEKQRATLNDAVSQRHTIECEIHTLHLEVTKTANEKAKLETELQCLRVAVNEAAQQKAQAEVEAQRQKQLAMEEADKKQKAEEEASRLAQAEKYSTNCYLEAMKELEDLRIKAAEALKKKEEAEKEAAQQLELAKAATQKQLEAEEQARRAASQYKEGEIQQPQAEEQLYAQRLQKSAEQAQRLAEEVQLAKQKAEEQAFICQQQAQDVEVLRAKAENAAELAAQAQRDADILRKQAEDEAQNKVQAAQEAKQQQELAKRELEKQKQLVEVTGKQKVLVEQQLEKLQVQLQKSDKQQVVVEKELEKMRDEAKLAAKQNKHLEEEHATFKIQLEELLVMKIKSQEEIQQLTEIQEKEKRLLLEKEEEKVKVLAAEAEKLRADAEMSARLQKDVEEELFEQCKLAEKIMKEKTEALEKAKRAQQEVFEVHKHCEDAEKHLRTVASGHDKLEEQLRHDAEHHQKALQEELRKRTVLQAEAQQLKNVVDELTREHLQTQAEAQKAHAEAQEVSSKLMTLQEGIAHKASVCDASVQKDNGEKPKPEAICFDIAVTAQPEFEDKSVMVDMTQTAEMPAGGAPENVMVEAKVQEAQLESKTDSLMSVEVATQVAFEEASGAMSESEKEARLSESNLIHEAQTLRKRIEEETSKHNVEKETLMMQQNILEEQKLQLQKIFEDELKNAKALLDVETKKRRKQEEDNVHLCAQMQEALREQKRAQIDIQKKQEKLLGLEQQKALKEKKEREEEHLLLKDQLKDQELQEKRSLEKQRLELAMLQSNVGKEVEQQNDSSVQSSFEIEKGEVSASTSVVKQATMTTTTTTTTTYMYSMKDTAKALEEVLITIPCGQMMGKTLTVWEVLHSSLIQESSSQNIISTYREGKTSTIKIIVIIVEIIEAGAAKTDRTKLISIRGIRHPVTLETLIQTGLLSEETASLVLKEKKTIEEVSASLKSCLQGTGTIAGVVVESTNETMDVYRAMKVGLLKPGIALELLEAQAATGFLLSPLWNERLTVEQAAQKQLISLDIKEKLLIAEKAVTGFKDLYTGKLLGIGQVLQKSESLRDLAVRLLEAQLATGGIIDPQLSVRLPLAVAHERGLLDAKMMQILTGGSCTARCYHDPITDEMCSYKELLLKCRFVVGLHILPIKEVPKERKLSSRSSVRKRKVLIIDPDSGKDLSIYEAYRQSIIDWNTYQELIEQESEWEEIVTSSAEEGTLSSVLIDRKSGRQFDIQQALANGTLSQRSLEQYRAGDLPVFELGAILTGKVKYPHTFPSEDNIQHLQQQQPLAEHTEEIGPVAGIINVGNMEKMSVMEAMQRGLVNRSTGRRLLEAQACTGGIMDINTGHRLSTESALKADLIDTFLFDQLTVAEKAYCGFWDTETKSLIPPSQALLKDLLFPEMAMYLLQVQYITGGLVEPGKEEKKKRMSLSDFQEKGYIDVQTVQKLKDMTTYPKCLTCPKNKKYISFKEALDSSIVDPQTGLKFLEAIANEAAACIRDQTGSDSASGFSGGSGSNLPGNVPFGATEQGGHRQSRNGSSFEQESWSSNTRQMRFESSQMNEKGLPETPGPSTSLALLAEGFSRNVEAENGGATQNATTKYNQNIDQDNKTPPFLVDCSVLEGGVPSGTEHLKFFLTETPEYGQDGRLIDDGSSSFPLTHDPQGDFKVNFFGDGSMTERHNLTPGTEPFPVPNIIEYPQHSCPCAGDTLFTHSSRPNNISIPEFSQYEHLPNNAVLQKQSFWAASATFNKLQTRSTNCPTAPRTCNKEDENISNVDNKRETRFLGSLMEKASCSKDMDCTPNVSSNTDDGEDENFAGKKATNPFSISENLCFADFQRWQEIQTELMPQITTVECACNQVAVYFGLDKMLIGESGSGGDLVNRCLALLQTLPRVVRCSRNAKLHKCTMLYLSADLITGTKGLRAFTSKVPTSSTTLFSCLEKQIVMPLNPVKAVSFPSRSFLSPLSFWHLSAALLLCHWCDGVSDMLTCALLFAMLLIIILPFIPACATQWILPLHCCSKCIFHRPRMYKLV